jgi:prepilin-type N-terminal cleavage/methylation domain-containing protein
MPVYGHRGFSLIELMIGLVLLTIVAVALTMVLMNSSRSRTTTMNQLESTQAAGAAVDMIARDVRSAGYDVDADATPTPQPPIAYIDSLELIISENLVPYPDNATPQPPLAYDPVGAPRPRPLDGTVWQPTMKYRSGAELVRYTLDLNNDGAVDPADLATLDGADARRTRNPNDYVLAREVFGDSTGNVAGNNGGSTERVAIVSRPGGTVPPIYTVYMRGLSTPWDWSTGPVPAARLGDIERVEVRVSSPSTKPDWRGNYANTELRTSVSTMRNSPEIGPPTHLVDGYIYEDANHNGNKDGGEAGLGGANVRLGRVYSTYSASNGYFNFRVPSGSYTLRHTPPAGYGVWTNPDSFVVNLASTTITRSFGDTARAGGFVAIHTFNDLNANGVQDTGEPPLGALRVSLTPGTDVAYTDGSGDASMFAAVGGYSVSVRAPDSLVATTPNPVSGSMTNGGSASLSFGFQVSLTGTIRGKVYRDNNRNAVFDGIETGIQNVYVSVTPDGGLTTLGYAYTDASGDYSITVPANDPPRTRPYMVLCVPPSGFFPTSSTALPNQYVTVGGILTGRNFGVATYQIITLNASRVLCLAPADLIEKDWNGSHTEQARADKDLVLGADAGGTDNISVWFNNYASTPLFSSTPSYSRNAPNSVMAIAADTLDSSPPASRPDIVTGTKNATTGNFFVWLNQNSSGNFGYFPTAFSPGMSYMTNDNGDVQAVLTFDCAGGAMPDIIVGTKSPTTGRGTIEVWQNDDADPPTFRQQEVYPSAGNIPGNRMGEVTAMALADIDGDGQKDLVVGTRTGLYTGELLLFQYVSKADGNRFINRSGYSISDGEVTSLACADVDRDGQMDIIVGVEESSATGSLRYYHNKSRLLSFGLDMVREVPTPGIPTSLVAADLGGGTGSDIAMGWRQTTTSYAGGILIYYTDLLMLPFTGVDPSAGSIANFVPAVCSDNFNFGVEPTMPSPPYLADLATGVKSGPSTGALVVFIR